MRTRDWDARGDGSDGNAAEDEPPWPLLDRYLTDDCSAADVGELERWLVRHPNERGVLASLKSFVREPLAGPATTIGQARWNRVARRMGSTARRWRWRAATEVGAVAAVLVAALMLVGLPSRESRVARVGGSPRVIAGRVHPARLGAAAGPSMGMTDSERAATAPGRGRVRRAIDRVARIAGADTLGRVARLTHALDDLPPRGLLRADRTAARAVSLADERPGAADTSWP